MGGGLRGTRSSAGIAIRSCPWSTGRGSSGGGQWPLQGAFSCDRAKLGSWEAPCGAPGPSAGCHLPGRRGWGTQSGPGAGRVCHLSLQGPTPRRGWVPALQGQRSTLRPGATRRPWLPGRVWGCHRACQSSPPPPSSSCDFAAGRHRTVVTHSVRYVRSVVQPSPLTFQNVPLLQIGMRPVGSHRPPSQRPPVPGKHRPPLCQPLRTFPEWSHNPWPPTPRFCRPGLRGSSSDR